MKNQTNNDDPRARGVTAQTIDSSQGLLATPARAGSDPTAAQAKERQEAGNNQHTKRPVEKIPQGKARDEAGKAADF